MTITTIVGVIASMCTTISLLPQLLKIIKEKKASTISFWMLGVLFAGCGLWIYYGVLKSDWIIIISNTLSILLNILITAFALKYQKQ